MLSLTRGLLLRAPLGRPANLTALARANRVSMVQARQMSFFGNIMENMKSSMSRDKELKEKLDKLEKEAKKFEESEALKKAKGSLDAAKTEAEKAREGLSKRITDVFQTVSESDFAKKTKEELEELAKESKKFTDAASQKGKEFSEKAEKTFEETANSTPYLKMFTSTIKGASDEILEGTKKQARLYGGFRNAEERREERMRREKLHHAMMKKKEEAAQNTEADPNAGSGIVLHKDSAWKQSWDDFRENNPFMQKLFSLKRGYDDSDSPIVHYFHRFQDSIVGLFAETEHAQVLKEIKMLDPTFNLDEFTKEMHDYIIPEVLEAFLHGRKNDLKQWCSEAAYSVLAATIDEREKSGLHVDSRILELKQVELALAKMIDERPILIFSFNTQQITVFRDNSGKIVEGSEDDIERVHYVMAMVKDQEYNEITAGWKVMEVGVQATMKTW